MPDAPVTVDVSLLSGPWPGMQISGITGTGAAALNGYYRQSMNSDGVWEYHNVTGNGSKVWAFELPVWTIELTGSAEQFEGEGAAPWAVESWTDVGPASGTPVLTRWVPPPYSEELDGSEAEATASKTTALGTANSNLTFTARFAGRIGNGISIQFAHPGGINRPLRVEMASSFAIVVYYATNGAAAPTTTASQLKAAIEANAQANALVSIANAPSNNGSGIVSDLAQTFLTGGAGGLPKPPVTVDI